MHPPPPPNYPHVPRDVCKHRAFAPDSCIRYEAKSAEIVAGKAFAHNKVRLSPGFTAASSVSRALQLPSKTVKKLFAQANHDEAIEKQRAIAFKNGGTDAKSSHK